MKYVGGAALGAAGSAADDNHVVRQRIRKGIGGTCREVSRWKGESHGWRDEGAMISRVGVTSVYVVNYGEIGNALGNSPAGKFQEFLPEGNGRPESRFGNQDFRQAAAG